ncbi:pyrroline-5-carboxylate reductase 3-like isoform X2 [Palaemon carinicauda]|uniref:pyrroline-5-carboxylate reductase 3-like isoform X2 n=1 Tax=Palaemon carinicauda TaxID=392227 RepID=UPI0035B572E0
MGKWKKEYNDGRTYKKEWEERFKWLALKNDKCYCKCCNSTLANKKMSCFISHENSKKHIRFYDEFFDRSGNIRDSFKETKSEPPNELEEFFQFTNETVVPVHQDGAASPSPSAKELIIPASVGFIGAGNMAQALMNAFLSKGLVEPHLLMASAPSNRNLEKLPSGMRTTHDNNRLVKECDIIFLCVKPHLLTEMIEGLDPLERDHSPLFISVVTGFDISTLEQLLGSLVDAPRVVRTMPNTPCMIGQGCCVYTMGNNANESDSKVVHSMLHSVGICAEIPEHQMDAACGLIGSGPAYIYAAIEALADGGVKMGLPRHLSQSLAAHMVKGAASMVLQSNKHPGQLKDEVCSPSGTTITAMHSLEKNGLRNALISAVEASANRSKELGKKS